MNEDKLTLLQNLAFLGSCVKSFTDIETDVNSIGSIVDSIVSADESDREATHELALHMLTALIVLRSDVDTMIEMVEDLMAVQENGDE